MLKGRTAIITGGSRGIGKAVTLKLAQSGANVAIIYAGNEQAAIDTVNSAEQLGVKAKAYQCDVSDFNAVKVLCDSVITDFGAVDILVNNAGITRDKLILKMTEDDFDKVLDTNLKGAFNTIRHLYAHFMKRRQGKIINITSVSGLMGNAGQANYSSAKAGLIGLTKTTAKELAGRNICCNAVAPGFIDTDMTNTLSDAVKEAAIASIPLKRMGLADEVASLVLFLASDNANYITGETIKVDGGLYI